MNPSSYNNLNYRVVFHLVPIEMIMLRVLLYFKEHIFENNLSDYKVRLHCFTKKIAKKSLILSSKIMLYSSHNRKILKVSKRNKTRK